MNKYGYILTLFLSFFFTHNLKAQTAEDFDLELFIETLFNVQEEGINYEDLYERLLLLYENPIDLNLANRIDLKSLFVLSDQQIDELLLYRKENGRIVSPYELMYLPGFDYPTLQKISPFITVSTTGKPLNQQPLLHRILNERNNYLLLRYERVLEDKRGYITDSENRYAGTADKLYLRYRVSKPGDFSLGLTTEKDPGEALIWDKETYRRGMDFWSFHFMLENQGKLKKTIVGDYQLQFGQGLLFNSGFGVGKGAESVNALERVTLGVRPYTSVIEGGFLRGAAATYALNSTIDVTAFYSYLKQDASIQTGEADEFENFFSSIQITGLHRTPSEIAKKKQIAESLVGFNLNYRPDDFKSFGVNFYHNQFSLPILKDNDAYNRFEFSGTQNQVGSIYGNYTLKQFHLFAEGGISKSGGTGIVGGFTTQLSPRIDFGMVLRNYDTNFHSFRGSAFGEGSRNINESGIYWGLKYTLNKQFNLTAYYDSFRFPWLRFRVNAPSKGNDVMLRLNYIPSGNVRLYGQFRRKNKEINSEDLESGETVVLPGIKNQFLVNLELKVTHSLSLKSRVQWSDYTLNGERTKGNAFFQDAVFTHGKWVISGRMALFDTEGNENRQYAYERDLLYAFSIPSLSGRGIRNYLLFQYKATRKLDVWAKVSRGTFFDRDEIGSGLETIDGNKRTDVKLQLRIKFWIIPFRNLALLANVNFDIFRHQFRT